MRQIQYLKRLLSSYIKNELRKLINYKGYINVTTVNYIENMAKKWKINIRLIVHILKFQNYDELVQWKSLKMSIYIYRNESD